MKTDHQSNRRLGIDLIATRALIFDQKSIVGGHVFFFFGRVQESKLLLMMGRRPWSLFLCDLPRSKKKLITPGELYLIDRTVRVRGVIKLLRDRHHQ
jgi:hypothetical protein